MTPMTPSQVSSWPPVVDLRTLLVKNRIPRSRIMKIPNKNWVQQGFWTLLKWPWNGHRAIDIYGYHFMMMVLAMVTMTTILMQSSLCNIASQLWIFHLQGSGWARQPYIHHVPWWLLPIPWQFIADCGWRFFTGLVIGNPLGRFHTQPHHHPCPIHLRGVIVHRVPPTEYVDIQEPASRSLELASPRDFIFI